MKLLTRSLAGAAALVAAWGAQAADHREAPSINYTPAADLNDIYAFRSSADRLVLVMTVNPISDRDFAQSYAFSPDVLYRFGIDTTGDGRFEEYIDVTFTPFKAGEQTVIARFPNKKIVQGLTTRPTVLSKTPNEPNIISDDENNILLFAGPRDDPFFFDAVGFNRFVNGTGGFRGEDSFASFNVSAIVIELPVALVAEPDDLLGIEGLTYLSTRPGKLASGPTTRSTNRPRNSTKARVDGISYEQVDRMGNPAVNTAYIPAALKDSFNQALPKNDADDFADDILATLNSLGTSEKNQALLAGVAVPDTLKLDLTQTDGYPNGRRLQDDVIDVLLSLTLNKRTSDRVNSNDKRFLGAFPYLAEPFQAN